MLVQCLMVGHGGVEPPYGAYKAPALTDELMAQAKDNISQDIFKLNIFQKEKGLTPLPLY